MNQIETLHIEAHIMVNSMGQYWYHLWGWLHIQRDFNEKFLGMQQQHHIIIIGIDLTNNTMTWWKEVYLIELLLNTLTIVSVTINYDYVVIL